MTKLTNGERPDYYGLLGLSLTATQSEIKSAYKLMAQKSHPDTNPKNPGAEEEFKTLTEAYRVLSDPELRQRYDQSLEEHSLKPEYHKPDSKISTFIDNFKRAAGPWPKRGTDLRYTLELDLIDVVQGGRFHIKVPRLAACARCQTKSSSKDCPACSGSGHVQAVDQLIVSVPFGVEQGSRLKLAGQGDAGLNGGAPGDLYVEINIKGHPILTRSGINLVCRVPVSFKSAAMGCELPVATPEGVQTISLPAGSQSGDQLRIPQKGLKSLDVEKRGDIIVTIQVETPRQLDQPAKELLDSFSNASRGCFPQAEEYLELLDSLKNRNGAS
jgi:molecular chaperone DnaJ